MQKVTAMGRKNSLRDMLSKGEFVVAPGVYSALSAKLVEAAGFRCMYMSGYCTAASTRGLPDLGLLTMTEMLSNVHALADAAGIPLIADGDTGYGNALNVVRTVREYEKAGAAAIHIEDQAWPKRCGHMKNKHVIPKEEMVSKVRAAVDCRASEDFVVIARTDAIAVEGLQAAIDRLSAYAEAGADVVFADGQQTMEHIREVPKQFPRIPSLINLGPLTPPLSVSELQALGYAIAIYPSLCIAPAVLAIQDALARFKETGTPLVAEPERLMRLWTFFNEFLNVPQYEAMEQKYKSA
jgi:2-methylisocitrate lyase-like PEP mutase family enzyme